MSTRILQEPSQGDKPDPVNRLQMILRQLPDGDRADVWEGIAVNLAKHLHDAGAAGDKAAIEEELCEGAMP